MVKNWEHLGSVTAELEEQTDPDSSWNSQAPTAALDNAVTLEYSP